MEDPLKGEPDRAVRLKLDSKIRSRKGSLLGEAAWSLGDTSPAGAGLGDGGGHSLVGAGLGDGGWGWDTFLRERGWVMADSGFGVSIPTATQEATAWPLAFLLTLTTPPPH